MRVVNLVALGLLLLAGCLGQTEVVKARLGEPFELGMNKTALIEDEGLKVTFLNVTHDSRCPSGVVCFWEGQVTVLVSVSKGGRSLGDLSLTSRGGRGESVDFDGYTMELIKVEPYPKKDERIEMKDYMITLIVSKG